MNIGCQVSPMSAGSPDSTLSRGGPLPTLNAPLSSAGDTDFSKILCGPCVQMPVACSLCCPSKGVGFKTHPETREKCLHVASQEAGSTAFCFKPQATGYPGDETASVPGTVQEATHSYFQVSQGHSLVT